MFGFLKKKAANVVLNKMKPWLIAAASLVSALAVLLWYGVFGRF